MSSSTRAVSPTISDGRRTRFRPSRNEPRSDRAAEGVVDADPVAGSPIHPFGVVPAAGHATRMGPLPGSKEMLPVDGQPVIAHLIDRMRAADCREIRVVTRPEKTDVIGFARSEDLDVVQAAPRTVSESLLAGIEGVPGDRVVLLGFPDSIWEPIEGFRSLVAALQGDYEVALGLFTGSEPERSDVVTIAQDGKVLSVDVKPRFPSSNLIWGCAAARGRALEELRDHPEPGMAFDALAHRGRVVGAFLSDSWVDIGTPEAFENYVGKSLE